MYFRASGNGAYKKDCGHFAGVRKCRRMRRPFAEFSVVLCSDTASSSDSKRYLLSNATRAVRT